MIVCKVSSQRQEKLAGLAEKLLSCQPQERQNSIVVKILNLDTMNTSSYLYQRKHKLYNFFVLQIPYLFFIYVEMGFIVNLKLSDTQNLLCSVSSIWQVINKLAVINSQIRRVLCLVHARKGPRVWFLVSCTSSL